MPRRSRKPRGPKKVAYTLIGRGDEPSVYKALDQIVKKHHADLKDARIALAWCTSWRPDVDGRQKLGQCKRASDLDRELMDYDFVILLHKEFWQNPAVSNEQRAALLDHELCHAAVKHDRLTGEPLEDERGRTVYRLRGHDLEEFACIAERHGLWKRDLERFDQALRRHQQGEQSKLPIDAQAAAVFNVFAQFHDAHESPDKTFFVVYPDREDRDLQRLTQVPGSTIYRRDHGIGEQAA